MLNSHYSGINYRINHPHNIKITQFTVQYENNSKEIR